MFRTGYSFRTAFGKLDDVLERLKAIGLQDAPIADRCSTFAYVRWTKAAKKAGLRPVYGVELAVSPRIGEKEGAYDYWRFLALDNLAALHELIHEATSANQSEPALLISRALAAKGVIKITGPAPMLDELDPTRDAVYVGIYPSTPIGIAREAVKRGFNLLAMSDNNYVNEGDRELYRVAIGRFANSGTYPQHILSDDEWRAATSLMLPPEFQEVALRNRASALSYCRAELRKATLLSPEKPKTLREMCIDGAKRLNVDLTNQIYAERLDRELALIAEKKFEDYFYIIADLVAWAKQNMVVGPARGSSCGSLVCYLLGITAIDPIPYDLLFERFIDHTRSDLPDIDIDFSDERRNMLFEYAERKYGKDRVARLGTVGSFMPKSALNQVGIALKIPPWTISKVSDSIIQRSSGDSRALQQLEDTLNDTMAGKELVAKYPNVVIAGRMEGHPTVPSQHAAGVLLTEEPLRNFVAVNARTRASMCDKKDAEELGLLKIDALGLTQLSIFERTLELIGKPERSSVLESIPLDDPAAFEVLNRGHYSGIFQFMGGALKSLSDQITFTSVNDLIAITALARPGPMATGGANMWVKRKTGKEPIHYAHPLLEPYLRDTLGIIVYQEQVMQICREIGELSWGDVNALRRAMSKSLGEEFFNQYGDKWKVNAVKRGIPTSDVDTIWKDLCAFGSMGFNKAHAVAYGLVSYWCCWLKAHHPVEFAAATLDAESDPSRQIAMLRELEAEGIGYVPIDPQLSSDKWQPSGNKLIGPLTNVKGIGPAAVREILDCRKTGKPLSQGIASKLASAETPIDTLYPVRDRVKQLCPDLKKLKIYSDITPIKEVQCKSEPYEVVIIGVVRKIAPRDENEPVNVGRRLDRAKQKGNLRPGWDGKLKGPTQSLNTFFIDDSGEVFCKIDRYIYERYGKEMVERGRPGKEIYAVKGTVPPDFRMISVSAVRYIGTIDMAHGIKEKNGGQNIKTNAGEQESTDAAKK